MCVASLLGASSAWIAGNALGVATARGLVTSGELGRGTAGGAGGLARLAARSAEGSVPLCFSPREQATKSHTRLSPQAPKPTKYRAFLVKACLLQSRRTRPRWPSPLNPQPSDRRARR